MENGQDGTKSSAVTQSFGVDRWQRKKSRYEMEDFIVSPPSQDEGGFFQLRYGKSSASKTSTYNKITHELMQDTGDTLAGAAMSYLGVENRRPSIGHIGGAISVDASGGLSFDDFSQHPDHPPDIPYSTMPDLTLEAELFPKADPLITLPWGKYSLSRETTSTPDNSAASFDPDYGTEEGKIVQAIKELNITAKEVTYADITTQDCKNIYLETPKTLDDKNLQEKKDDHMRERKRSGLQDYVASIAKQTKKPHHHLEEEAEEEHDEEDKKEVTGKFSTEHERQSEVISQHIESIQQNDKTTLNNQYSHHNNFNETGAEDQNNDLLYEAYKSLAPQEPAVINDIENTELQISHNEKNTETPEDKYEFKSQEPVKHTKEDRERKKTPLLSLVTPFIPFKESGAEPAKTVTPEEEGNDKKNKSKAVSRFFCTEGYEERKKSNSSDTDDLSHNSEQLKSAESNISDGLASSKPKVKKRRPKPSALREMNVWGPSSM